MLYEAHSGPAGEDIYRVGTTALPDQSRRYRTVLRTQRSLEHLLDHGHPLVAVLLAVRRQVIRPFRCEQRKTKALILGADRCPYPYAVPIQVVAEENLPLRVGIQRVVVVHELPVVQREPSPLVAVGRSGSRLEEPALPGEIVR